MWPVFLTGHVVWDAPTTWNGICNVLHSGIRYVIWDTSTIQYTGDGDDGRVLY